MSTSPISHIFASQPLVRLLSVLLLHPERRFYQQELLRLTGTTLRPLQLALERLERAGLVEKERQGRNVYYRVATTHPAFGDLRDLFRKTVALADVVRESLAPLADSVHVAFIFGSVASGTERATSDVDLLVVGEVGLRGVAEALSGVENVIGREVNAVVYEPQEFRRRVDEGQHFVTELLAGPKMWLLGDEHELERLAGRRKH